MRILVSLLLAVLLTACVSNRGVGQGFGDGAIDLSLKRALLVDRSLDSRDVDVAVFESRVLLTGTVSSPEAHRVLIQKAANTPGVTEVIDEVKVGPRTSPSQGTRDALIDRRLGTALLADNGVYSNNYIIVVSDGTIYLLGVAQDPQELDRVIGHAQTFTDAREIVSHVMFVNDPRRQGVPG